MKARGEGMGLSVRRREAEQRAHLVRNYPGARAS